MASALLEALESDDVYISEGAETPATASSTLVRNEKVGARKPRSQADSALGLQERGSVVVAPEDVWAGRRAACGALYSCSAGDLQGLPAAELSRLVDTLWRIERTTSCGSLEEDLEAMETQLREFEAAAEACAPVRFMGAMVVDLLVNLDVRAGWKRREREWAAATASKGAAWGAGDACIPSQVFPGLSVSPSPSSLFHIQLPLPTFSPPLSHPTTPHPIPPYPFPSRDSNSAPFPSGDWSAAAAGRAAKWRGGKGRAGWWWFVEASDWNALMRALHGSGDVEWSLVGCMCCGWQVLGQGPAWGSLSLCVLGLCGVGLWASQSAVGASCQSLLWGGFGWGEQGPLRLQQKRQSGGSAQQISSSSSRGPLFSLSLV